MTMQWRGLTALLLLAAAMLPATFAQVKKTDVHDETAPGDEVIEHAMAAYRMADFGHKHQSPEALLAAAGALMQLKQAKLQPLTETPTDAKGQPTAAKIVPTESFADEADALFDEARKLAADQKLPGFDVLIAAIKSRQSRGVRGGTRTITRSIGPGESHVYRFQFECARPETISFRATTPMKVSAVRTDIGNVWIAEVARYGTQTKTPGGLAGTLAPVTIQIHNRANQAGEYRLYVK